MGFIFIPFRVFNDDNSCAKRTKNKLRSKLEVELVTGDSEGALAFFIYQEESECHRYKKPYHLRTKRMTCIINFYSVRRIL